MLKQEEVIAEIKVAEKSTVENASKLTVQATNAIHKGSKVTGNLTISQDLQITGEIEGNITAENNASIFIKGSCKGNIKTKGGSVEVDGEMSGGDISAGGHVKVTGKFHGGKIQAKERIHINGEFSGTLESNDVEIGEAAQGKGEIYYKESLCIQKGAKVEGKVTRSEPERKPEVERKPERLEVPKPKKGFFAA